MGGHSICLETINPTTHTSVLFFDLFLGLPTLLFTIFLAVKAKAAVNKLVRSQSHIMATYYAFLWLVCILNLLRASIEIWEANPKGHYTLWNVLWLTARGGMLFLEVSVVVFLAQGYLVSSRKALIRTLVISSVVALVDSFFKVLFIWVWRINLFGATTDEVTAGSGWNKWMFWGAHTLIYLIIYMCILALPHTRWRDRLPARPSFYRYVLFLVILDFVAFLGAIMLAAGATQGYCLYGICAWVYYAFYPPILYMTFLAEFFQDTDDEESAYYSEMKDAGYFEDEDF
ncbi:hypothetical protein CYMTET_9700 [Cymbomonas tetramitiformis]|uniref:Transmembrane protein adipocyte-associated 1 n=1 Tax=Cymbomonas tetramitiformis TaxID=36881 RepID=A0AAE0GR01_9CHLO|nr:hypothetical protein CYMTET_9700 [Cymbomonas tetramitiformis]